MSAKDDSPPGPSAAQLPARSRMAIENFLTHPPENARPTPEGPLTFLSQDDLCVKQPFEVYVTYAQALSGRHEELSEVEKELQDAERLVQELNNELEIAENAKPRRARIIGPIRIRLQNLSTQRQTAAERCESAKAKVVFSENTMRAMDSVLVKFGWQIRHSHDEITLQPHPSRPAP